MELQLIKQEDLDSEMVDAAYEVIAALPIKTEIKHELDELTKYTMKLFQ